MKKGIKSSYDKFQNILFSILIIFGALVTLGSSLQFLRISEDRTVEKIDSVVGNINDNIDSINSELSNIRNDIKELNENLAEIDEYIHQDRSTLIFESEGTIGTNAGYQTTFYVTDCDLKEYSYLYCTGMLSGSSIKTSFLIANNVLAINKAQTFTSIVSLPDTVSNTTFYYVTLQISQTAVDTYTFKITNIKTYKFNNDGTSEVISSAPSGLFNGFHYVYGVR